MFSTERIIEEDSCVLPYLWIIFITCQLMTSFPDFGYKNVWKTSSKMSTHSLYAVRRASELVKSCIISASLVCLMHLCTSQKQTGVLDNSTCAGERKKPVSLGLSCLKWCRVEAIWHSRSLKSSSPPELGHFLAVPFFLSKSVIR